MIVFLSFCFFFNPLEGYKVTLPKVINFYKPKESCKESCVKTLKLSQDDY